MPPKKYKPLSPREQQASKQARARHKALHPFEPPKAPTVQSLLYDIYKKDDALEAYKFKRAHATDIERLLTNRGEDAKLAKYLSPREQLEEKADLTFIGIQPGHISYTLPERLTIRWMLDHGYSYGGDGQRSPTPGRDFYTQYPLGGGRSSFGGGLVGDLWVSPSASGTNKGLVIAVDGQFWHSKTAVSGRDAAQNVLLLSQGYKIARITDQQTYNAGELDSFMKNLLPSR